MVDVAGRRVAIVTDSTADIPAELMAEYDIHSVPLNIWIGGKQYLDRVTISPAEFMDLLTSSNDFPTTSQPSVGAFQELYEDLASSHDQIVSIHLSSRLSGTYQSAVLAADTTSNLIPVTVVDTGTVSMALGFAVLEAGRMTRDGKPMDEIVGSVKRIAQRCEVLFLVDTLEYLRRGGRIGRAAELLGSILQVKPILKVDDGVVVPFVRTRTRPRAISSLVELIREIGPACRIAVVSTSRGDDVDQFMARLEGLPTGGAIIYSDLSPVLSSHTGPGCIGVVVLLQASPDREEAIHA